MSKHKDHAKHQGKFFSKLKDHVKTLVKKGLAVAEDVEFAPLLPFKPMMIKHLDKLGISHTKHLHDVVPKFLEHIVKK